MKLSSTSPAAARQQQIERLRRERTTANSIRSAFPRVQQLRLELQFDGRDETTPAAQVFVLYPPARAYFEFPCPYTNCDGHFNLAAEVDAAVSGQVHKVEGLLECCGERARLRVAQQACKLQLNYTVTAEVRQAG